MFLLTPVSISCMVLSDKEILSNILKLQDTSEHMLQFVSQVLVILLHHYNYI